MRGLATTAAAAGAGVFGGAGAAGAAVRDVDVPDPPAVGGAAAAVGVVGPAGLGQAVIERPPHARRRWRCASSKWPPLEIRHGAGIGWFRPLPPKQPPHELRRGAEIDLGLAAHTAAS
jgi:hypothetical protein